MNKPTPMNNLAPIKARLAGFTLIEMVAVLVVLAILAALGGQFVLESSKSYNSTRARAQLMNTGRQAVERMSRQLRIALPYSVRVTNGGSCLEFMPIASGGNYLTRVPDANNAASASSSLEVSPHSIEFGSAVYVAIGAMSATELYGASPGSLASLSSRTVTTLTLGTSKTWLRNSTNQRFYLLDAPQAFCVVGTQLRFYANQALNNPTGAEVNLNSTFSLMADNVTASSPFSLSAGSENRNTNVVFNINFVSSNPVGNRLVSTSESLAFNQSVMIRNVP